ncbi:unnamed protein product, partial [Polarella glacialis]
RGVTTEAEPLVPKTHESDKGPLAYCAAAATCSSGVALQFAVQLQRLQLESPPAAAATWDRGGTLLIIAGECDGLLGL